MADDDDPPIPPMLQEDSEATLYKYRDFSAVPEDPDHEAVPPQANRSLESSIRVQKFPVKLYAILGQKEFSDIIIWMPHGRSWKVLKPNLFESLVMPLFFEYSNYHSFNRLVNAWSFRRISSGPDRGSYYHELFLRGKPHLQKYMRRLPKTHKKLPMKKCDEPDFYKLAESSPLPEIEESQTGNAPSLRRPVGTIGAPTIGGVQAQPGGLQGGIPPGFPGGFPGGLPGMQAQMGQLSGQLGGQLSGQLSGQLGGQLGGQLSGQLGGTLGGQLGGQFGAQFGGQFPGQLGNQFSSQLGGQLAVTQLSGAPLTGAPLAGTPNAGAPFAGIQGHPGQGIATQMTSKPHEKDEANSTNDNEATNNSESADNNAGISTAALANGTSAVASGQDSQLLQLQRLRQLQQLQLLQRQLGPTPLPGGDDLTRLGLRGLP